MKFNVMQSVIFLIVFSPSTIYSVLSEQEKKKLLESIHAENYEQLKNNFQAVVDCYLEKKFKCNAAEQKDMYKLLGKQLEDEYAKQHLRLQLQDQRFVEQVELRRQEAAHAEQSWSFLKLISPIIG